MKRRNSFLILIGSLLSLIFIVSNVNADVKAMPLTQNNGCGVSEGVSVYFNDPIDPSSGKYLRTDKGIAEASIGPLDIDLPAGRYQVVLTSFDHHSSDDGSAIPQENEQWYVIFEYDNGETAVSGITPDLPEDQDWLRDVIVNHDLQLTRRVVKITAMHAFYGDPNYQSVYPVCLGLKLVQDPPASIGDFVWLDNNQNGVQDRNEPGVENVTVHLLDGAGNILQTQVTNGDGRYHFTELDSGEYAIQVIPPAEYGITIQNNGEDHLDSDIDQNGRTAHTHLEAREDDLTWDAGLILFTPEPVTIEAIVFCDVNQNGIQEEGEQGLPDITAHLIEDGNPVEHRPTNGNGQVIFTDRYKDNYTVEIDIPVGHFLNRTATIYPVVEASKYQIFTFALVGTCGYQPAEIGDLVWLDGNNNNVQDAGEEGVSDVTVILFDAQQNEVARTTTDQNGRYLFTDLQPAQYSLQFFPPDDYYLVTPHVGSNDAIDSDADGNGRTPLTELESGESDLTWDAGLTQNYTACGRFNLDLGRSADTGAGVAGRYEMIEVGTGKRLATWDADFWWADSGWIEGIELSNANGSWVEVFFYPHGQPPAQKLEIINPAPGTEYGWLAPGMCHAVEIEFPIDWIPPNGSTTDAEVVTVDTPEVTEETEIDAEVEVVESVETIESQVEGVEANSEEEKVSVNRIESRPYRLSGFPKNVAIM